MRAGRLIALTGGTLLVLTAAAAPVAASTAAAPGPQALAASKKPCPSDIAQGWKCITLTVPADHFHNSGMTTKVTFALKRHSGSGPAKGTWVTITGGPGTAGIYSAVDYTDTFAPSVRRDYDLVFMDQRGSGQSGGFTCPNAALDLYTDQSDPNKPGGDAEVKSAARDFVEDCLDESSVAEDMLPFYGTRQAVEDLEAFRLWLGVNKLALYGESYGTQYVQQYAAAHPNNVQVLMIDGPVDLKTNGPEYYVEGTIAFDQTLQATLLACTTEELCSRDVKGGNELGAYDKLAARLDNGPITYTFTFRNGSQEQRQFTATDLENAAAGALNNRTRRRMLQRAMAAASHGEVWRLARLAYDGVAQDPDTLEPILDPSWSDALYYAVECMDYSYFPNAGTPNQRAQAYLDYGRAHGVFDHRILSSYLGDLPCVYWPTQAGPKPRPTPRPDAPYPLVVMGSTTDPLTPFGNAQRIVERRGNNPNGTWLIYQPGGPHVIYGRYESCPDDYVTDMLVKDKYPNQHTLTCPGGVAADYVRTPDASQILDSGRKTLLVAYDGELNYGVDYWYWDYSSPLKFGCEFGGTIRYTATANGSHVVLDHCSFLEGSSASGSGSINDYTGGFRLDATFTGEWHGTATYRRFPDGHSTLSGSLTH
jgi:pimeloyl-ACP methyl ester carboxylesterase